MNGTDSQAPLSAVEYRDYLSALMGPANSASDGSDLIVTVVDRFLRLAVDRQAEEIALRVRDDGALDIRLRRGGSGEVLAKFCGFLSRQGLGREAEEVRGLRPEAAAGEISRLLDRLESGRLLFGPL